MSLELWNEYAACRDVSVRNRLVLTYVPLVKHIAYKKIRELPASCEVDDLLSCGIEALIHALDRYDPDKGAGLEAYLWTRIHGAILDELRRRDWAPRSLRRFERELNGARDSFTGAHGRTPSRAELAAMLALTPAALREREQELQCSELASLSALVMAEGDTAIELGDALESDDALADPEERAVWGEAKRKFRRAMKDLPERELEVAVLMYVKNLTLREVGQVLDVSESRVSQIHTQMKRRLREQLASEAELFSEVA